MTRRASSRTGTGTRLLLPPSTRSYSSPSVTPPRRASPRPALGVLLLLVTVSPVSGLEDGIRRLVSGTPDLTGNYDISTRTPFERDPRFGDRLELTREEVLQMQQRIATQTKAQSLPSDPNRGAPEVGGNVGGYNAFYLDLGESPVEVSGSFRTSILVDPANGRLPPLTEQGKARRAGMFDFWGKNSSEAWWLGANPGPYDGPETLSIADRCIYHLEATVPAQPRMYNNLKTIVQTTEHVMILTEWMHTARIVRLGTADAPPAHAPPDLRSRKGDSIGWWEGDTLVVETTNFLEEDWVTYTVGGNASPTADQRVVERFTPLPGGDLLYRFTVHSSDFVAPYSGEYTWPATDAKLYEYACHEGNYAMGNILRGARLLESESP